MSVLLHIRSDELAPEDLDAMTRRLRDSLNKNARVGAEIPRGEPRPGEKGDPVTIGVLALAFLTSGAAVAVCEVLTAIFKREKSVSIEFETSEGKSVKFSSKNMTQEQLDQMTARLEKLVGAE